MCVNSAQYCCLSLIVDPILLTLLVLRRFCLRWKQETPIVLDRNAHLVPLLVRVADLMWCGAGLSCFQKNPGRSGIAIPIAVYTVTLPLVHLAQGWDTGPGAIGEDMHMMLKCYFAPMESWLSSRSPVLLVNATLAAIKPGSEAG